MRFSETPFMASPMDGKSVSTQKVDLDEVLNSISSASRKTFKDSKGNLYTDISVSKLQRWHTAIADAQAAANGNQVLVDNLEGYKKKLVELSTGSDAAKRYISELTEQLVTLQADADKESKKHKKRIDELSAELTQKKKAHEEALAARVETLAALKKAEAQLQQPEATYLPEAATRLQQEVAALKGDLQMAADAAASSRAELSHLNSLLDIERKAKASCTSELEASRIELSSFKKRLAAAKLENFDDFSIEDLSFDELALKFGKDGVEKLRKVLAVESYDVFGRIAALTGFFSVVGRRTQKAYAAMPGVLKHALDVLKSGTTTWIAVLAPWVNMLLKDIVFLQLKSVGFYRKDLEVRISKVKILPPQAPVREKIEASASKSEASWAERLRSRTRDIKETTSWFKVRLSETLQLMGAGLSGAWQSIRKVGDGLIGLVVGGGVVLAAPVLAIGVTVYDFFTGFRKRKKGKAKATWADIAAEEAEVEELLFVAEPMSEV